MKKILLLLVAFLGISYAANAQVCKISGSNDNVEVFSCYADVTNNQIVVTVSNDSQDISANVTVEVTVSGYDKGSLRYSDKSFTVSGKGLATPNQTTTIKINVPNGYKLNDGSKVSCSGISGTKCI